MINRINERKILGFAVFSMIITNICHLLINHCKWPNRLNEASHGPVKKEELAKDCSSNPEDALLLHKEVSVHNVFPSKL